MYMYMYIHKVTGSELATDYAACVEVPIEVYTGP